MSDDVTAAFDRLSRVIVSVVRSEAVLYTDAPADLVKKLVVARINAIKDLQLFSEEEAALLVSSLDPSDAHVAPPPLVTPDGAPSPCGMLYSLIHRRSPESTPDDLTVSIPNSVGLAVAGAMIGSLGVAT
jgi:hypothetical protein